jgi:DNA-directed RNA polymerase subunit E'/Rpb7
MAHHEPVKFRMIVFRPFKGEIMLGKISSSTDKGIKSMCLVKSPIIFSLY